MDPAKVERILRSSATDHACPEPRAMRYDLNGDGTISDAEATFDATCEGDADRNGFYGDGIVNALAAVTDGRGGHGHDGRDHGQGHGARHGKGRH